MKLVKKALITFFKVIGILLLLGLVAGLVFINTSPEFGGVPSQNKMETYKKSGHFDGEVFVNDQLTTLDISFSDMIDLISDLINGKPNLRPGFEIPVLKVATQELKANNSSKLIWFGHSAFLLQMDGKNILLDPMFGEVPAPSPYLGQKRYFSNLPIEVEDLPMIDAVVISHDHYDHLDYGSIQKLKSKTNMFFVPLGVGAHFMEWGINESQITEMNWWETNRLDNMEFSFTPSRHFSGRGLTDRNTTLWGSWVIKGKNENLFFSGDGGYGPHFKKIGEKFGPFDLALIECGQYNEKWSQIHMMPEQSAQAGLDLKAMFIMPIHWGAFTLAMHSWTDPVIRIKVKAEELGIPIITPKIGGQIEIKALDNPKYQKEWWVN